MDRTHDGRQTRRRGEKLLRAKDLLALSPGRHSDGGGLALIVKPTGARRWSLTGDAERQASRASITASEHSPW